VQKKDELLKKTENVNSNEIEKATSKANQNGNLKKRLNENEELQASMNLDYKNGFD